MSIQKAKVVIVLLLFSLFNSFMIVIRKLNAEARDTTAYTVNEPI